MPTPKPTIGAETVFATESGHAPVGGRFNNDIRVRWNSGTCTVLDDALGRFVAPQPASFTGADPGACQTVPTAATGSAFVSVMSAIAA